MRRLVLIIAILLVLVPAMILVAVSGTVNMQLADRAVSYPSAPQTAAQPPQNADGLLEDYRRELEAAGVEEFKISLNDAGTAVTVGVFLSADDYARFLEAAAENGDVGAWYAYLDDLAERTAPMARSWKGNGGKRFAVNVLRASGSVNEILASLVNGELEADQFSVTATEAARATPAVSIVYVLNTSSGVFHLPGCAAAANIAPENRMTSALSRGELLADGFSPCGLCDP